MSIIFQNKLFKQYAETLISEAEQLKKIKLGQPKHWDIDWGLLKTINYTGKRNTWDIIPVYKELLKYKNSPAVYYFTFNLHDSEIIFQQYSKAKNQSSEIRKSQGVRERNFNNICHVPKAILNESNCLYVGSRKRNIHTRFLQHLGVTLSGRTGALYLSRVLSDCSVRPKITFNYYILNSAYKKLTEHIECVLYKKLNPILGKSPK